MTTQTLNGGSEPQRGVAHTGDYHCPTCDSVVSPEVYAAIIGEQAAHDAEIKRVAEAGFASREATIRREATAAANAALAPKLAEAAAAKKLAEQAVKATKQAAETEMNRRLAGEREKAAREKDQAVNAERLKAAELQLKRDAELKALQRRNEELTAHQLGEPAEVELFDALVAAFPQDCIRRVAKGQPGPDVICEVIEHGDAIGKIVVDSKNYTRWSHKFTPKLRADQIAEDADFAILSSNVFPPKAQQLYMSDGVIVAHPARVVVLVGILRALIVQTQKLKMSAEARNEKAGKLYALILSPVYSDMLDRMLKRIADLEALQADEQKEHERTWKKRAGHTDVIRAVIGDFSAAVAAIIAGAAV